MKYYQMNKREINTISLGMVLMVLEWEVQVALEDFIVVVVVLPMDFQVVLIQMIYLVNFLVVDLLEVPLDQEEILFVL
jgi:hypothetical protein